MTGFARTVDPTTKEGVRALITAAVENDRLAAITAAKLCANELGVELEALKTPTAVTVRPIVFVPPGGAEPPEAVAEDGPSVFKMTAEAFGGATLIALVHAVEVERVVAAVYEYSAKRELARQGFDPSHFGVTDLLVLVFNKR